MLSSPIIHCEHEALRERFVQFLEALQLPWPEPIVFTVATGSTSIFPPDERVPVPYRALHTRVGPPTETVRITWSEYPAESEIHATAGAVTIWMSEEAVNHFARAEVTFLTLTLIFLLRRVGWYHLHGVSLLDPRGRGWLLVGNSRGGKSTTTALLMRQGWTLITDDVGFAEIRAGKITVHGPRRAIGLRDGGRELLGIAPGFDVSRPDATGFWPEDLGGAWTGSSEPQIIAFPQLGERTSLAPTQPRSALSKLVTASSWVLLETVYAQPHLDALGLLAKQSRCFDLTIGPDLIVTPQILESLVE